ncbi:MAG: hypothetical protein JXB13_15965 [Phycisphaerae bacterium]|nr:hypothetical protein [Phycisphaerae bacterium]
MEYKDTRHVEFLDHGWQERRFGLIAVSGRIEAGTLHRRALEFQTPALIVADSSHAGSGPRSFTGHSIVPDSIAVFAIKPGKRSGLMGAAARPGAKRLRYRTRPQVRSAWV